MSRRAFLLLPLLGLVLFDPSTPDDHAVKYAALMAGALLCVALAFDGRRLAWSRVSLALWVFLAVRGVMLLNSPISGRALRWWSLLLALVLVHHAACATTPRRWLRRWAPRVFPWVAAAIGLYAVVQTLCGLPQGHAFFANRNFAGAGLAMLLPYVLAAPRWKWPLLATSLAGLLCMQSRGGLLAAAAAGALYVVWRRRELAWPVFLGLPVTVLLIGLLLGGGASVKARLIWYEAALEMGIERPALGLGADGFLREYPPRRPAWDYEVHGGATVHSVHNDYLESFAEGGLAGLAAHLFLLVAAARALRRQRLAAASLLAFATASLVDLPLRDPSLLALAFFGLAFAGRRRARLPAAPLTVASLVAIGAFLPLHVGHWRADRELGRYLGDRDRRHLDEALALERRHPEALIARSRADDLALLLEMEPHHAGALYNRTRFLADDEAARALREILADHDPNHRKTKERLAQLEERQRRRRVEEARSIVERDPLRALSILEAVVREGTTSHLPYLLLARIQRRGGRMDAADRYLREAEARSMTEEVIAERLTLAQSELAQGRVDLAGIARAGRAMSSLALAARIDFEAKAARAVAEQNPAPGLPRRRDEAAAAYARRLSKAKVQWRNELRGRTRPNWVVARVLAEVLAAREPTPAHLRLVARAVRGEGDLERAREMEAAALFLETLEALGEGEEERARRRFDRALRAYPGLPREKTLQEALRLFAGKDAERLARAQALFGAYPELLDALEK